MSSVFWIHQLCESDVRKSEKLASVNVITFFMLQLFPIELEFQITVYLLLRKKSLGRNGMNFLRAAMKMSFITV